MYQSRGSSEVISAGTVAFVGLVNTVGYIVAFLGSIDALLHIFALKLVRTACLKIKLVNHYNDSFFA